MGSHRSTRAGSGWSRRRRAAIVGLGACFVSATVIGVGIASGTTTSTGSVYSAIAPVTVLGESLAADSNTDVAVAGVGSVPSSATSVQLSVTALDGTTTSSMYVYATGATKPTSANVRWMTAEVVTIPVTVAVGTSGDVRLSTDGGTVTVKVAVVGYFSPAQPPGSSGYGVAVESSKTISADGTTIASLTVPAGTYEVQGKATMGLVSGTTDELTCYLEVTGDTRLDWSAATLDSDGAQVPMSMVGLVTTVGGNLKISCVDVNSIAFASEIKLVAIQLSTATGDVTGS